MIQEMVYKIENTVHQKFVSLGYNVMKTGLLVTSPNRKFLVEPKLRIMYPKAEGVIGKLWISVWDLEWMLDWQSKTAIPIFIVFIVISPPNWAIQKEPTFYIISLDKAIERKTILKGSKTSQTKLAIISIEDMELLDQCYGILNTG